MSKLIFISYRRQDSLGSTGRLYDRLLNHFSSSEIFIDVDTIDYGEDFIVAIERAVSKCNILLAVIGKNWLECRDKDGSRMIDNPNDFVRVEIRSALLRNIRVIPVLVEDAKIPASTDLPEDIKKLSNKNAIEISHTRFNSDVDRLIRSLQKYPRKANIIDSIESVEETNEGVKTIALDLQEQETPKVVTAPQHTVNNSLEVGEELTTQNELENPAIQIANKEIFPASVLIKPTEKVELPHIQNEDHTKLLMTNLQNKGLELEQISNGKEGEKEGNVTIGVVLIFIIFGVLSLILGKVLWFFALIILDALSLYQESYSTTIYWVCVGISFIGAIVYKIATVKE